MPCSRIIRPFHTAFTVVSPNSGMADPFAAFISMVVGRNLCPFIIEDWQWTPGKNFIVGGRGELSVIIIIIIMIIIIYSIK